MEPEKTMLIDFFIVPVKPSVQPRRVVLLPITEEDDAPFPRLPNTKPSKPRKPRVRASPEEIARRRRLRRKLWLQRPEVAEYQKMKNRERQRRFEEKRKAEKEQS